jgi:hypothetical protein
MLRGWHSNSVRWPSHGGVAMPPGISKVMDPIIHVSDIHHLWCSKHRSARLKQFNPIKILPASEERKKRVAKREQVRY